MNRYERLFCKKYLEILADVEDMKGLETAGLITKDKGKTRAITVCPEQGEALPGPGQVPQSALPAPAASWQGSHSGPQGPRRRP